VLKNNGWKLNMCSSKNKQTHIWWSKFTDEESMRMYTKEWVKLNWGNLVW